MNSEHLSIFVEVFAVMISAIASAIGAYIVIRSDLRILMAEHSSLRNTVDKIGDKLDRHLEDHSSYKPLQMMRRSDTM